MESKEPGERGSGHLFSTAKKDHHGLADDRNLPSNLSADLGGEESQGIPRQQVAAETEPHDQKQQDHSADPCEFPGFAVRLKEQHAEHVRERGKDHQVGRPGVDGANQPAKLHPGHDVLHALEGFVRSGPVVQKQQNPGQHLDDEQEESDAAKEVPIGEPVQRNGFLPQAGRLGHPRPKPFVQPIAQVA